MLLTRYYCTRPSYICRTCNSYQAYSFDGGEKHPFFSSVFSLLPARRDKKHATFPTPSKIIYQVLYTKQVVLWLLCYLKWTRHTNWVVLGLLWYDHRDSCCFDVNYSFFYGTGQNRFLHHLFSRQLPGWKWKDGNFFGAIKKDFYINSEVVSWLFCH